MQEATFNQSDIVEVTAATVEELKKQARAAPRGRYRLCLHRSTQDPDAFLFYEIYADDAAFDAHRASPHLAAYRKRREDEGLLEGSVDVKVYRAITE